MQYFVPINQEFPRKCVYDGIFFKSDIENPWASIKIQYKFHLVH